MSNKEALRLSFLVATPCNNWLLTFVAGDNIVRGAEGSTVVSLSVDRFLKKQRPKLYLTQRELLLASSSRFPLHMRDPQYFCPLHSASNYGSTQVPPRRASYCRSGS